MVSIEKTQPIGWDKILVKFWEILDNRVKSSMKEVPTLMKVLIELLWFSEFLEHVVLGTLKALQT